MEAPLYTKFKSFVIIIVIFYLFQWILLNTKKCYLILLTLVINSQILEIRNKVLTTDTKVRYKTLFIKYCYYAIPLQ